MNNSPFSAEFLERIGYGSSQQPQPSRTSYAPAGLTTSAPAQTSGGGGGSSPFSAEFLNSIGYGSSQPAPGGYQPPSYTPPSYSGGWDPYTLEDEQAKREEEERKRRNPYGVVRNKLGQAAQGVADVIGQGLKGASVRGAMDWMAGLDTVPTIGGVAQAQVQPGVIRERQAQPMDPTAGPLWKAGGEVQERVAKALPVNEDATFWDEVARGAGSSVGFGMGGLLTGGNPLGVAMSGAMVGMGSGYEEAKAAGADDTEAQLAGALSGLVGVSEVAPVGKWVGKLTRVIPQGKILNRIKDAGIEGLEEAIQEAFQSTAGNAIAREIYDEDRELFEGVARSGAVGGVSGLLMGAVVNALPGRQRGPGAQPSTRQEQAAPLDPLAPQATEQTEQQQTLDALNAQLRAGQTPLPQGTEIIQGAPQEIRPPKAAAKAAPGADIFSSLIPSDEIEKLERFKQEQQKNKEAIQARQAETKLAVVGIPEETLKVMTDERKMQLAQSSPEEIRSAQQKLEERKAETTRMIQEEMAKQREQREAEARAKPAWMKSRDEYAVHSGVYEADEDAQADAERRQWQEIEAAAWRGEVAPSEVLDPAWRRKVQQIEAERSLRAKEDKWQQWEQLPEAEQDALVYEYEREMMEESGELDTPDFSSPDELQNRISRTGKLMHPDNLRDANDPLAGEVRAIYNALNVGQRRKLFAGKSEGGLTLDAMRESLSEGGSGFDYSTPDDLLQAMDESIMRGRPQMANYAARPDDVRFSAADPAAQDAEYMAAVERGDTETAQRLVDERAKAAGYEVRPLYHGGPDGFFKFDWRRMGEQGTSEGKGFYFTNEKDVAAGYSSRHGGRLLEVYLKSGTRLDGKKNTIPAAKWKSILLDIHKTAEEQDGEGSSPLWNFDDVGSYGANRVATKAAQDLVRYSESDVDLIAGLIHAGADPQMVYDAVEAHTGKTGILEKDAWDKQGHEVHVATSQNAVKSADPITRDDEGNVIPLSRRFDSRSPDIRYSAGQGTRQQASRPGDAIDQAVADLTSRWKQGRVEVKDLRDLPAGDLREMREKGMLRSAGYFNTRTGRITLIRNNLTDPAHAVRVALHEAVGHYGVRAVLGDQFNAVMQMVADAYQGKELWRKTLARWKLDPSTRPGDAIIAAEEIVAQMAEGQIDNPSLWTRITAAIRLALGMISSQEWTDIQIRRLLTQSRRYLEGRRKAARSTSPAGSTAQATRQSAADQDILALQHIDLKALTDDQLYERGDVLFEQWEQAKGTEKARLKRLYNKIEQEQRDRRVAAFINKPPPPVDFAQLDAEYMSAVEKGDTAQMIRILDKVAKEKGYTIKGFHGTPDGRFIDESHRFGGRYASIAPAYQEVFWFAKSAATAASYADDRRATDYQNAEPRTWQGYLKITNPLEVFAHGRPWRDAQLRGKTGYVIDEAREKGNDGIIIYDVKDNYNNTAKTKTTDTYSVFKPEQIKSADPITRDDSGRIIPPSERFKDSSPDIRFSAPEPVGFHMYPMEVDVGKFTDAQLQERLEMLTNLIEERQADKQPTHALFGLRSEVRAEIADRKLAAEQEGEGDPEEIQEPARQDAPPVKPNPKRLRQLEAEILEARAANKTVAEAVILERNQLAAAQAMSDITQAGTMKRQAVEQLRKDQAARIMEGVVEEAMTEEQRAHMATVKNLMLRGATYQEKPRWERIKEWFKGILDGWDQYAGIKNDDPRFTKFRDQANDLRGAKERIAQEAQEIVKRIVGPIDKLGRNVINKDAIEHYRREVRRVKAKGVKAIKQADLDKLQELEAEMLKSPYALFQNLLLYKDLATRAEMISPLTGKPVVLPQGLKKAEVVAELNRLIGILDGHEFKQQIIDAMRAHYQAMASEKGLLEKYGYLIPAEQQNPYYYPHLVIDYMSGKFKNAKVIEDKPFRGYMEELTGSKLDIETDYISAVFSHLYAVRIHNAQADFVKNGIESYDITEEIRKELQDQENEEASGKNRKAAKISASEAQKPYNIPEGYVLHTIDERLPFRPVEVIDREKLGKALGVAISQDVDLKKFLKDTGADVKLTAEMIEGAMAIGKRRKVIIPVEMHRVIREFVRKETMVDSHLKRAFAWINTAWKKQKLYFPTNWIRYEYGNLSTDIIDKVLVGDPGMLRYLPRAWREVRQFWREGEPPSKELQEAYRNRVLESVTAREVGELGEAAMRHFDNFATTAEARWQKAGNIAKSAMSLGAPQLTTLGVARNQTEASSIREGIFRYAKYLAALDRMRHGADPIYQGAAKVDVEATTDSAPDAQDAIYRKAAKIARRTFVDYGEMSANGEALRKAWVPFWSWMEGNWKYHRQLRGNLRDLVKAGEITAMRGNTVATVHASRIAAGVLIRIMLPYLATNIWNNAIAPLVFGGPDDDDLEKYLSEADRRKMHIITGFDPDTKRTRIMYTPTAFADVLEWFSGMEGMSGLVDAGMGRITLAQAAQEWAMHLPKNFFNKGIQSVGPAPKIAYTWAAKKQIYPDVFDQRSIPDYDLAGAVLGQMVDQFTAQSIRQIIDKDYVSHKDLGDWAQQLILQQRYRNPESWAYYSIRDKAADFAREKYGSDRGFDANNSKNARAVSGFRKAIYYGDPAAAMHWYLQLLDFGYTKEQFQGSIRTQNPLNAINVGDRAAFLKSLTPYEREQVQLAMQHYAKIRSFKGRELDLFPRKAGGDREADYYRKKADSRAATMQSIIHAQDRMSPEALRRTGESLIREEEYRW